MNRTILYSLFYLSAWPGSAAVTTVFEIPDTVHVLGLANVSRDAKGTLKVDRDSVTFQADRITARIPATAISEFAIERESKGLVGGTAGKLILLAPFGTGSAVSMIRPGVDMVALQYNDDRGALHGCLLMLPKGRGADLEKFLAGRTIEEGSAKTAPLVLPPPAPVASKAKVDSYKLITKKIQVAPVEAGGAVPTEFRIAVYEQLYETLRNCGLFLNVWRSGDRDAADSPERLVLATSIDSFKKGSARVRLLSPVGGATVVKARVRILDGGKTPVMDREVTGSVWLSGENLSATGNLAKKVAELIGPKF